MLVKKITPPLFQPYLIYKNNRDFIEGRSNKVITSNISPTIMMLFVLSFILMVIIISMPTLGRIFNAFIKVSLLNIFSMLLSYSLLISFAIVSIYSARMDWILNHRKGKIIQGILVSASVEEDSDSTTIIFNYSFYTPDGRKITQSSGVVSYDVNSKNLPPNGTQLAVLYINDKIYTLL